MAAPVAAARTAPGGVRLDDGFTTKINIAADTDISLWEKTVTPPGLDGGDPVDTTTMWNTTYRTKAPRELIDMTDMTFTAAYSPAVYPLIVAVLNVKTTITVHWPNGATLAFFGFLRSFEPGDLAEGEQPEATVTITPTNQDPTTGAHEAPVYTAPA